MNPGLGFPPRSWIRQIRVSRKATTTRRQIGTSCAICYLPITVTAPYTQAMTNYETQPANLPFTMKAPLWVKGLTLTKFGFVSSKKILTHKIYQTNRRGLYIFPSPFWERVRMRAFKPLPKPLSPAYWGETKSGADSASTSSVPYPRWEGNKRWGAPPHLNLLPREKSFLSSLPRERVRVRGHSEPPRSGKTQMG